MAVNILRHLGEQRDPVNGKDVATAIDVPHGTVMCHLVTLEEEKLVRCVGGAWELDMGMAIFWARKKAQLAGRIARDTKDLETLGE